MTPPHAIPIAPDLYQHLGLDAWLQLSDGERLQIGDHLSEQLLARGWQLEEPAALRRFGPAEGQQPVLQFRDARVGMTFSLIPSGTFRPGYSPELLLEFRQVWNLLDDVNAVLDDPADEEDGESQYAYADRAALAEYRIPSYYGCGSVPCDIRAKEDIQVFPFLMATEPIHGGMLGMDKLVTNKAARQTEEYHNIFGRKASGPFVLATTEEEVTTLNRLFGWDLLTSVEFEWAVRGGSDGLFYWGNQIPRWLCAEQGALQESPPHRVTDAMSFVHVMDQQYPADRLREWPWCNRFGLAGMLTAKPGASERPPRTPLSRPASPSIEKSEAGSVFRVSGARGRLAVTVVAGQRRHHHRTDALPPA